MNTNRDIPPIVKTVLNQAARLRSEGLLRAEVFNAQIKRLETEELEPRGFALIQRDLPDGIVRFLIRAVESGKTCEMIECCSASGEPLLLADSGTN